jgi:hypothetical protein
MCGSDGTGKKCIQNLVRKLLGQFPLEGQRRRWEDNIGIELRKVSWKVVGTDTDTGISNY